MTLTVYFKGVRHDEPEKFSKLDYDRTDIDIEYEGQFGKVADRLKKSGGRFDPFLGTLSGLFTNALLTVVDDDDEEIMFVFETGFIVKVTFTESDEEDMEEENTEEEKEEEEEEKEEEEKEPERAEPTAFPIQENNPPEKLTQEKKSVKHIPFSNW
jgi:hypothetical protein